MNAKKKKLCSYRQAESDLSRLLNHLFGGQQASGAEVEHFVGDFFNSFPTGLTSPMMFGADQ